MGKTTRSLLRPAGDPVPRAGFSLIDVTVAVVILVVALGGLSNAVLTSHDLSRTNEETSLAGAAARRTAETLRRVPFREVFRRFNADPLDDPGGEYTGEGPGFAVRGLTAQPDDLDGLVGHVSFPTVLDAAGREELRENVEDRDLGMPRDLDLDGEADGLDHADDYRLLPVEIRLEWRGAGGDHSVEYHLLLVD